MSQNIVSQKIIIVPNNSSIKPLIDNNSESLKRSKSYDILEPKIIKKYKKLKLILKRPKKTKILKSVSPKYIPHRIMTFQKTPKNAQNLVYNRKILSEKNKDNKKTIQKNMNNLNKMKLSDFKINKEKNNINSDFIIIILNALNKMLLKYKKVFFFKIKYYNKIYLYCRKSINDNINVVKKNRSLILPILPNNKNFLEENNLENKTIIYKNKTNKASELNSICSSDNDSCDKNLTITYDVHVKKLIDSNSDSQENEINDEHSVTNRNYSYDKNDIIENQETHLLENIKGELKDNLNNKEISLDIKNKNNFNKESLLFSEEKILKSNKNENEDKSYKKGKFRKNLENIKNEYIQHSPNFNIKKKKNFFINDISFEKIENNYIIENSKNNNKNKKINFSNSNTNNTSNNNIISCNFKNKNIKEYYENTFNSVEETTNINEYDNNPINRISYEDEKIIFNNSNPKNVEYIFNNKILNNSNEIINIKENVIEKNGELYYPVDESINVKINQNMNIFNNQLDGNEEEEIDINSKNEIYFKIRVVDKEKRLISFLFFPENKNRNNKAFKAKISLYSYGKIIKKILEKNKNDEGKIEENLVKSDNNKYQMSFSIRSYEAFIQILIDEICPEKDRIYTFYNIDKISNDILNFENKIKDLKKCVLYLLVKKHYLKDSKDKEKLILDNNPRIEKQKRELYDSFQYLKNKTQSKNIPQLLNILEKYQKINSREIKMAKMLYNKEKTEKEKENKNLINYGSLILPFVYIAKFLSTFQKV